MWTYTPVFSPDGSKIAFMGHKGDFEIFVVNADGRNLKRLTESRGRDGGLAQGAWSPDGSKITFMSERDGNREVYVMNADGTNQTRLTNHAKGDVWPVWSPDGKKIAYVSGRDGNSEIYVMNPDGTSRVNVTRNAADDVLLSWIQGQLPKLAIDQTPWWVDRYAMPKGDVEALLKFIEDLKQFRPQTDSQSAEHKRRAPSALKAAATRILKLEKDEWSKAYQTALRVLLEIRIANIPEADRRQQGQTVRFVKTFLKAKLERRLESLDVDLATSTARALETSRNLELAAEAYSEFAGLIAESGNAEFSETVKHMKDAAKRLIEPPEPRIEERGVLRTRDAIAVSDTVDWTLAGFDAERTSFNPHEKRIGASNVGSLAVLWRNRHSSTIRGFVSVVGERAYYGDYGGEFRAVEAATGRTIWRKRLQGKHQGHAVVGGVAYVSSIKRLFAFDAASGEPLWSKDPSSGQFGGPMVADGILYVGTSSPSTLHALDASTGSEVWSVPGGGIAVSDGVLYKVSAETLQALDSRTGETLWQVAVEEGQLRGPAISDGVVYVHSTVGKLYAFDATDREAQRRSPLWVGKTSIQEKGDGTRPPAVGHGKVFVGANSTFYAFDTAPSEKSERIPVWTATVEAPFFASSPSVANGVVYSTAGNHDIYAFDVATGKVLWNYHTRGREYPMRSKPTIVNGRLYHAATFEFTLYVFHVPKKAAKGGEN
jgi:outer membrane protein assembly factor BamB